MSISGRFPIIKSPIQSLETHSEGIKIIPKTSKNSKVILEIAEKVRLAIKGQQLARNIKKTAIFF